MMYGINTFELSVALLLLVMFFSWPWREYWQDVTRQKLFDLREQLFLMACDGKLSFDDDLYLELRSHLNMSIRFTHRLRISVLLLAMTQSIRRKRGTGLSEAIDRVDDHALRVDLHRIIHRSVLHQVGFAAIRSPLSLLLFMFIFLPLVAINKLRSKQATHSRVQSENEIINSRKTKLREKVLERAIDALDIEPDDFIQLEVKLAA